MSNQNNVMAVLKTAKPTELVELDVVKDRFITLHNQIHGNDRGELIYHKEVFNYKKMLSETPALRECSPLSLYGCFLDINVNGLSLETGNKPDCYITTRNFNVGTREVPQWEKRAQLVISPYGEVKMRMRSGQIKYTDNPVVVYEGDTFRVGLNERGKKIVKEYEAQIPRAKNAKIIACFVRVERPDGSFEMPYLDMEDVLRLKGYSERQNNGKANALYTSFNGQIDPGFLAAKTLKHAFKSYPKVPTGQFSALEPEEEVTQTGAIDYGFDAGNHSANAVQDIPHEEVKPEDPFDAALAAESKSPSSESTVQFTTSDFDDEPNFD